MEIPLYRIVFSANNPQGGYVAGDTLDVFAETDDLPAAGFLSSTGIYVRKNGVLIGTNIYYVDSNPTSYKTTTSFNPQYCSGTTLYKFDPFTAYPYGFFTTLADHPACVVNSPVCDLIIVGQPSVIPSSGAGEADGTITVTAQSTNPIKYKLGSDFSYEDGTAQVSNIFTELLPGQYRVYIADSINCKVNVLVTVPISLVYNPKYRIEYNDIIGGVTRIDIGQRGYVGGVQEVCGTGIPLVLGMRAEGSDDKFTPIIATDAVVELLTSIDGQFRELYTNDPELYRIYVYKNSETVFNWIGKVIPGIIEEQYQAPPYAFIIRATDGLPRLKDIFLMQDDGQRLMGTVSLITLVAYCLSKTKLGLGIRVACNIYATGMDTTDNSDPLDQAYIDYDLFYLRDEQPNLEDVLVLILETFGARLIQWGGYWNIIRIEETVAEYDYRVFDADGIYVSDGSFDPVLNLGYPEDGADLLHVKADQNLEIRPGFGTIRTLYRLGYKDNILRNGDFRLKRVYNDIYQTYTTQINTDGFTLYSGDFPKAVSYKTIEEGNVALVLTVADSSVTPGDTLSQYYFVKMGANNQLKFHLRYMVEDAVRQLGATRFNEGALYTKVRIVIQYGPLYLTSSGSWTADYNEITVFANDFFKFQDYEVITPQPYFTTWDSLVTYSSGSIVLYNGTHWASIQFDNIGHTPSAGAWWESISITPTAGMYFRVKVFDAFVNYAQFTTLDDFKSKDTVNEQVGFRTEAKTTGEIHTSDPSTTWMDYFQLREGVDAESLPDIVRPYDFNASSNPKVYERQGGYRRLEPTGSYSTFYVDKIQVTFLTDGREPIDTIVRDRDGEINNKELYVKEFWIGSYSDLIVTNTFFAFGYLYVYNREIGVQATANLTTVTESVLSADLIYAGYLRSQGGIGWDTWARDGIAESDKLHGIMLRVYAAQYKNSWRRMRGSFHSNTTYFGFLNVVKEINAGNRIYMPIGLTIDDKNNIYSGELLELANIYENPGSDGSGEAPYSSGFTTGFGASGFN